MRSECVVEVAKATGSELVEACRDDAECRVKERGRDDGSGKDQDGDRGGMAGVREGLRGHLPQVPFHQRLGGPRASEDDPDEYTDYLVATVTTVSTPYSPYS